MKKRVFLIALITMLMILLCSCNNESNDEYEPDYTIFDTDKGNMGDNEDAYTKDTITEQDNTKDVNVEVIKNNSENINHSNSVNDSNKSKLFVYIQWSINEQWPYPLDFEGITPTRTSKSGNLSVNLKNNQYSFYVCPDIDNNIVYYVNYGFDNYIYQLKDGKSSLVLEKEAFSLNLWENKLYFLCKNGNSDKTGDIYSYNLDTKELELIKKVNAELLIVDSFGIYYEEIIDLKTQAMAFYRINFEGTNVEKLEGPYIQAYYEYQLIVKPNGIFLYNTDTKEEIFMAPIEYYFNNKIYGNYFIIAYEDNLYLLDLISGERKCINIKDSHIDDFIIIDDTIYYDLGWSINFKRNELYQFRFDSEVEKPDTSFSLTYQFSDGTNIYSIASIGQYGLYKKIVAVTYDYDEALVSIKEIGE